MKNYIILILLSVILITIIAYKNADKKKTVCLNCNVILITMDAVRADHLGVYGYSRNTSPNIDKLAKEGLMFTQAYTQGSWTLPSISSIFTSLYPSVHKAGYIDDRTKLDRRVKTIPEIIKENNYTTAAFVSMPYLSSIYNFDKGFDMYNESFILLFRPECKNITTNAAEWLEKNKNSKFFLFLHYFGSHSPYNPPQPYVQMFDPNYKGNLSLDKFGYELNEMNLTEEDVDHIIAGYDGSIRYTDECVGELLKKLKDIGLINKTIIILTSDHGERLHEREKSTERGKFGHGGYWNEVLHVPLIIKFPFLSLKVINKTVQLLDVMPTILDILEIPPDNIQGKTLMPIITEKEGSRVAYSEFYPTISIIKDDSKILYNRQTREILFYNLTIDPKELMPTRLSNTLEDDLEKEISEWIRINEKLSSSLNISEINTTSEELVRRLKGLGYADG